jgi:predicted membrane-bound dolichyl-phosphate-mannose-protein mannosyltransferase
MKKYFYGVLLLLFVGHLFFRIYEYRKEFLSSFDPAEWKQRFEYSQWSTKKACENPDPHVNPVTCIWDDNWYAQNKNNMEEANLKKRAIGDDGLYTYVGWEYVHGLDPTTLNAEIPPFGKYFIGVSELVFKNQNIFALLSGLFALAALYFFTLQVNKNYFVSVLTVTLFSLEPLFYTQLRAPFLDTLYLGLLLMTFCFFLKKKYFISCIFLGLMAATKSSLSSFLLVIGAIVLFLLITKRYKELKQYCLVLPTAFITFLLTYIQYFLSGHTVIEFLGVQKWILLFYTNGAHGSLTAPWEMLFTGKFTNWWGERTVVSEWHPGWAILLLIGGFAIFMLIKQKKKSALLLVSIWVVIYTLFLSFVPLWSRYLLLLLPFLYYLNIWAILQKFNKKHEN